MHTYIQVSINTYCTHRYSLQCRPHTLYPRTSDKSPISFCNKMSQTRDSSQPREVNAEQVIYKTLFGLRHTFHKHPLSYTSISSTTTWQPRRTFHEVLHTQAKNGHRPRRKSNDYRQPKSAANPYRPSNGFSTGEFVNFLIHDKRTTIAGAPTNLLVLWPCLPSSCEWSTGRAGI